tara:strand:+ start:521 stop:757 length:237 start_codon:yes stop_codon:yes gene_type:complete
MYVSKIINIIKNLKDSHPKMNIGKHIATALDGEDVWSITDKKFYQLISNYQAQLDMVEIEDDNFTVDKIIEDGLSIGK